MSPWRRLSSADGIAFSDVPVSQGMQLKVSLRQVSVWTSNALGSLKLRITLGGIAALVFGIGLVTFFAVNRAELDLLQDQQQQELGASVRAAEILSRRVVTLQRSLQAAADQLEDIKNPNEATIAEFLKGKHVLRSLFGSLFVAAPGGRILVLVDEEGVKRPDIELASRDYFQRTLTEERAIVSEPIYSRISYTPIVVFTTPVRNADGIFAVMGGSIRLANRDLLADLTEVLETDTGGSLVIVSDAKGRILAPSSQVGNARFVSDEPRLAQAYAAWKDSGRPVEPSGLQLPQPGQVVTVAGVAGPDWLVWRARTEDELLLPLRAARHEAIKWAAVLILVVSVILLAGLTFLLRPLSQLERRTQRLGVGDLNAADGWPRARGEIGQLTKVLRDGAIARARLAADNSTLLNQLSSAMNAAPVGIAFARNDVFELVNEEFCRLFQTDSKELLGQPTLFVLSSWHEWESLTQQILDANTKGQPYAGDWLMQRPDGSQFWAQLRSKPVDPGDFTAGAIWTLSDISQQRQANQQLEWAATHDGLTGLANRKLFEQHVARVLGASPHSLPAALVFVDLDRFKPINDASGHAAGDAVLVAVAAAISSAVRHGDLVARLGGDEFALLLERCSTEAALRIAEDVCAQIAGIAIPWSGQKLTVGSSLGVSMLAAEMDSVAAWIASADTACYAAKAAGRGTVRLAASRNAGD
jgi:diguanylate cyclase (GGDEF)-like protein/PAS domain S-box-containing protein